MRTMVRATGYSLIFSLITLVVPVEPQSQFPPDFMFGCASSSYQMEGAWNEDGKSENIWDHMLHEHPDFVVDGSNGDVASDSYHKYLDDVTIAKDLNLTHYRLSLSWPRILPSGDVDVVNPTAIDYYNRLIDALIANGIIPMVTLYHWDLPQSLQYIGGWPNEVLVEYFVEYAKVAFENFGDRVKWWITFNEPNIVALGYGSSGGFAPSVPAPGIADYLAAHNILKAHARVYHLYNEVFRPTQQGKLTIGINSDWHEPATNSSDDIAAADRARDFTLGWFAHPIYSAEGDYPSVMRQRVDSLSIQEGRPRSRLPIFTPEEIAYIRGTSDFFGLNSYSSQLDSNCEDPTVGGDSGVCVTTDPSWPSSASWWVKVVPWGMRKIVNWITANYPGYSIMVTETGFCDLGELNDTDRIHYITGYLRELLGAINDDGANVFGYTLWSLIDAFEWNDGFRVKFGLHHVDFDDPSRPRTPKASAQIYEDIILTRQVPSA